MTGHLQSARLQLGPGILAQPWNPGTALVRSASKQVGQRLKAHRWERVHSAHGIRMQGGPLLLMGPQYTPPNLSRSTDASQRIREAREEVFGGLWRGKGRDWCFGKVTGQGWVKDGKDSSIRSHGPGLPS